MKDMQRKSRSRERRGRSGERVTSSDRERQVKSGERVVSNERKVTRTEMKFKKGLGKLRKAF